MDLQLLIVLGIKKVLKYGSVFEALETRFWILDWPRTILGIHSSVAISGRSLVIADHLGLLVGQNRCRFLKMTEHN